MEKRTNWFGWAGIGVVFFLICAFFSTQIVQLASAACTNTTNLSLCKPQLGDAGWGTSLNTNFDTIDSKFPGGSAVPSNVIVFTSDATCPTGFTEYTTARGRFLVGVPAAGTNEGTVGATVLTNLQDKTHTHTYTDVVNHLHSVDPPNTSATVVDNGHSHTPQYFSGGAPGSRQDTTNTNTSTGPTSIDINTTSNTTGITASVNVPAFNSENPTGGVATGTTATTALSSSWPYLQLRLCKKS